MNGFISKVVFVGILVVVSSPSAQEEQDPELEGRKLSHWRGYLLEGHYDPNSPVRDKPDYAMSVFRNAGATTVPTLAELLKHESTIARLNAAATLKRMGPEARSAIPALIKALGDKVPGVQAEVCDALQAIGIEAKPAMATLAEMLDNTEIHVIPPHAIWRVGDHARDALVAIGDEAVPIFLTRIRDKQAVVRFAAIQALESFVEELPRSLPEFVRTLDDSEPYVRGRAAQALGRFGPRASEAIPALMKHLNDGGQYGIGIHGVGLVDADVAHALGQIGPTVKELPGLIARMQKYPRDPNGEISEYADQTQQECAIAIGKLGIEGKSAIPALTAALKHDSMKWVAAVALLQIDADHQQARQGILSHMTAHPGSHGCVGIIEVIRRLKWQDAATVAALEACVQETELCPLSRMLAECTLLDIDPHSKLALEAFKRDIQSDDYSFWMTDVWDEHWWKGLIGAIHKNPTAAKMALPVAFKECAYDSKYTKARCLDMMRAAATHAGEYIPKLIEQLSDERVGPRQNAVEMLGAFGPMSKSALLRLVDVLQDKRPVVRAAAAHALGEIGEADFSVITELTVNLKDDYAVVRMNAANSLSKLGGAAKAAVPTLIELKRDEFKSVQDAASRALAILAP